MRGLCEAKFFRRIFLTAYCSQKKKRWTKITSRIPWRFAASSVNPKIIPKRIIKNIDRIMPKFC